MSKNETEEFFNFICIKGESSLGHTPRGFLSRGFRGRTLCLSWTPSLMLPSSFPHRCGTRKVQPSRAAYPISSLEPTVLPQSSKVESCADSYLFQEPSSNKPAARSQQRHSAPFKDINTHPFTHQIICKDRHLAFQTPPSHRAKPHPFTLALLPKVWAASIQLRAFKRSSCYLSVPLSPYKRKNWCRVDTNVF